MRFNYLSVTFFLIVPFQIHSPLTCSVLRLHLMHPLSLPRAPPPLLPSPSSATAVKPLLMLIFWSSTLGCTHRPSDVPRRSALMTPPPPPTSGIILFVVRWFLMASTLPELPPAKGSQYSSVGKHPSCRELAGWLTANVCREWAIAHGKGG